MKKMDSRFPGICQECGKKFGKGAAIYYDSVAKKAYCESCGEPKAKQEHEEQCVASYVAAGLGEDRF